MCKVWRKTLCMFMLQPLSLWAMDQKFALNLGVLTSSAGDNEGIELMPDSPDFSEFVKNARAGNIGYLRKAIKRASQDDKNLALVQAAQNLDQVTCAFLLRHEANATAYESGALSGAVHQIIETKATHLELLTLLLEHGARDSFGGTCMQLAKRKKRTDIVNLLIPYTTTEGE